MVAYQTVVELPCCCCGSAVDVVADVAVVALDAVESQCVRADVCTCGRVYVRTVCRGRHRFTRKFVVAVVVAVEIHVRACIMCRPWTKICRLFWGSAKLSKDHQDVCGNVRERP